jgi:hypothetical protein
MAALRAKVRQPSTRQKTLTALRSAATSPRTSDVPERLRGGLPLNPYNRSTFSGGEGRVGFIRHLMHIETWRSVG